MAGTVLVRKDECYDCGKFRITLLNSFVDDVLTMAQIFVDIRLERVQSENKVFSWTKKPDPLDVVVLETFGYQADKYFELDEITQSETTRIILYPAKAHNAKFIYQNVAKYLTLIKLQVSHD